MKVAVIGGGGREHAIIKKLKESKKVEELHALPGNAGMEEALCHPEISATDVNAVVAFAQREHMDYVVVTPDDPLALGMVDALEAVGIPCFGPEKAAARLEASKAYAKEFMKKYGIPTASYRLCHSAEEALEFLKSHPLPLVFKADGLALGKGVFIAKTEEEADQAIQTLMVERKFGDSGKTVVIEEMLEGPEVSLLTLTDGNTVKAFPSSMDHKRALNGNRGPNTGGMGCIAPNPFLTDALFQECMETIVRPTIVGMQREGHPFKGCLYFGLMLTQQGPKVIEYNSRFGDPETQVLLPLLQSDLLELMMATTEERLDKVEMNLSNRAACCLVLASGGYPGHYEKGKEIHFPADLASKIIFCGVNRDAKDGGYYTAGGRVLNLVETGLTLPDAIHRVYQDAEKVTFENCFYRKDIGESALAALEGQTQGKRGEE